MAERRRIAYFSLDIANTFNELLLQGVRDGAAEAGVDLLVVHGGQLDTPHLFEAHRNRLYQFVQPASLDGLLLADIFAFSDEASRAAFLQPFAHLPRITIGHSLPGVPRVVVRNRTGFEQLVHHLLDQGCTRLAAITGPKLSGDTQERLEALQAVLAERGLSLDPRLVYAGDFSFVAGRRGVQALLDERQASFDALVCFNDNMAIAALEELKARGLRIPEDLKITGFDNTAESRHLNPPLTTVTFPIYELGKQAVHHLARRLAGGVIPGETILESRFIPRRSSGTWEEETDWQTPLPPELQALRLELTPEDTSVLPDLQPPGRLLANLVEQYRDQARGIMDQAHLDKVQGMIDALIRLTFQTLQTSSPGAFLNHLQNMLGTLAQQNWDLIVWQNLLGQLGRVFIQKAPSHLYQLLQLLYSQALDLTRAKEKLVIIGQGILDRRRTEKLLELGEALGTAFDRNLILDHLKQHLSELGLEDCSLVLFVPGSRQSKAELVLDLRAGHLFPVQAGPFDPRSFLPRLDDPAAPPLFMDCLHIHQDVLGYILYSLPPRPGLVFKILRHQLSTALLTTNLVGQIGRHTIDLEARIKARTRELEVANTSLQAEIRERELMEKELLRQKNLESLGLLAGGIAHDFNNLLTGILGNISLLEMGLGPDETAESLADVMKAIERAKGLTRQLLTFSRGGAPTKAPASLPDLVEESARFSLRGAKALPVFRFQTDLWPVDIDQTQISQVLNNLIINAVQAMPGGGDITFEAVNQPGQTVRPGQPPGDFVQLSISDQGHGIAPEVLDKIFEPYFTTKVHGNGLGLATSLNIIRRHGGDMKAESAPQRGTRFVLWLPRSQSLQTAAGSATTQTTTAAARSLHFLVLDDEVPILRLLERILKGLGHSVATSVHGEQALDLWQAARTSSQPFDALILDVTIPGGLGGLEVLQRIRQTDKSLPALVSSGYSDSSVLSDFQAYGFSGILKKPYTVKDVQDALAKLLPGPAKPG